MKLNEIKKSGMVSLETIHGISFLSYTKKRPTPEEARKALATESPILYAKNELKITKAPDSTSQSVIRYLEAIAGGKINESVGDEVNEGSVDVLWKGELDGEEYIFIAEGSILGFAQNTKGGIVHNAIGGALKFMANPIVAGMAAGYAIDAIAKYRRNKRYTTSFFAKDSRERTFYQGMVDDLMKTGKYKKVKEKYADGGYIWVLQKVDRK